MVSYAVGCAMKQTMFHITKQRVSVAKREYDKPKMILFQMQQCPVVIMILSRNKYGLGEESKSAHDSKSGTDVDE